MLVDFNKSHALWFLDVENLSKLLVWNKLALVFGYLKVLFLNVGRDALHDFSLGELGSVLEAKEVFQVCTK